MPSVHPDTLLGHLLETCHSCASKQKLHDYNQTSPTVVCEQHVLRHINQETCWQVQMSPDKQKLHTHTRILVHLHS